MRPAWRKSSGRWGPNWCRKQPGIAPGAGVSGLFQLGFQLLVQLLAGALDHGFGNRNLTALGIDDRAANWAALLQRDHAAIGSAVVQAHGLSPLQVVRAV